MAAENVIICPYNDDIDCPEVKCEKCGWHPDVIAKRHEELRYGHMNGIKLYKVPFTGFCEVWAKSPEDAVAKADDGEMFYVEHDFEDPICLTKEVTNEVD